MTTAQADAALDEAQLLIIASLQELIERLDAGLLDEDARAELATDLFTGAAAVARLAQAVAA
ncbi:hypothetical protein [Amnibacterium setariae]|uniref:Uncharacterized protein n=1 Tax=Amnibacterium setariae TaxID=2306585 RepID=A0A3A1TSZ5_9MICO|nr:hypothetical protein [Amnibacterium setariae]RIX26483.1 hypothetical protein D1781_16235 [Amnibacterium setariae]